MSNSIITNNINHYIIRVGDGTNFRNCTSKYPIWGFVPQHKKKIQNEFKKGDILWFLTNKKNGDKIIGMAEYQSYYDRNDEQLIYVNTYSNEELNWEGNNNWAIQIQLINLYNTEKQNIKFTIKPRFSIHNYSILADHINRQLEGKTLYEHYNNFKYYAEPKVFES